MDLSEGLKPLGYILGGKFFIFGEGEVSLGRFNEVVGGDIGGGWTLSFEPEEGEE
jgi:hypothetical protein